MEHRQSLGALLHQPVDGRALLRAPAQLCLDLGLPRYDSGELRRLAVAMKAVSNSSVTIADGVRFAEEQAATRLAETTLRSYVPTWRAFGRYCGARGVEFLADVQPTLVIDFKAAKRRPGEVVAANTQRRRQSAVSYMFDTLRVNGVVATNPCHGIDTGYRRPEGPRPFTDDEIEQCRWAAESAIASDRFPRVLALAEAGLSAAAIGHVEWARLDLNNGVVEAPPCRTSFGRTLKLTAWGTSMLRAAAHDRPAQHAYVAIDTADNYDSRRSSVGAVLTEILKRAGYHGQPQVEPRSIAAWTARRAYDHTGRIESAAYVLGVRSVDATLRLIGVSVEDFIMGGRG